MLSELNRARKAFGAWKQTPLVKRIAILESYAHQVEQAKDLATLISEETGKPLWESTSEVVAMVNKVHLSIQALQERAATVHTKSHTLRHLPHGVFGVLGPFNFPGHLPNAHIVPALLAGNTVVFKPSEHAPRVGERMAALLRSAGLPEGVLEVVQGDAETGWKLATHPELNGLLFTGSVTTGLKLSEYYGKHPDKILALEMGGNNPLIVDDLSDVQAAVLTTLHSAYLSSGQRCSCARRLILVDSPRADYFLEKLIASLDKIRIGHYTDTPEPFMGPLIHSHAAKRVLDFQEKLLAKGARPLKSATLYDERFVTPGVLDVTSAKDLPDEECFGPLLQLIRLPTLESAVQEANKTRFGLSAALISDNADAYTYAAEHIRAGIFNWNAPTTGASSAFPFGGIGLSGNARPSAYYACDTCAYPMVSKELPQISPIPTPGLTL